MKTNFWVAPLVIALLAVSMAAPAFAAPASIDESAKRYLTSGVDEKSLKAFQEKGCEIIKKSGKTASLRCPEAFASGLNLKEDLKVFASDINADRQIGADKAWALGYTGTNMLVAVLDSGIDYNHPEFADSYAGGWNFVAGNGNVSDDNGHGTHVAGIITANGLYLNSKGAAPGAKILALKVLDANGFGYLGDVIDAIHYAVDGPDGVYNTSDDFNPDAISMSFGTNDPYLFTGADCDSEYTPLTDAVNYAVSKGVTVVAAAGNNGNAGVSLPACISGAIAVGAVDSYDAWWISSGVGDSLDIVAPGVGIYSTVPKGSCNFCSASGYMALSGTSMATPHVSAVIALLKQANSSLSVSEIKNALYATANDFGAPGRDGYYGAGRVNAFAAINYVLPARPSHDVAVSLITAQASAAKGSFVPITVEIKNEGKQKEIVRLTVSDETDSRIVGLRSVFLDAGASQNMSFSFYTGVSSAGNHTIKAAASAVPGETDTSNNAKKTVIAITALSQPKMHVLRIDMAAENSTLGKRASATVYVVDALGNPVSGANISGRWSGLASDFDFGTTDSSGKLKVYSDWKRNANGDFVFAVSNITKAGWIYDSSANAETSDSVSV